jgi:hypothetical protein
MTLIDGLPRNTGDAGDLVHPDLVIAALDEQPSRDIEQPLAGGVGPRS